MFNKAKFIDGFVEYYIESIQITALALPDVFNNYISLFVRNNSRENNEQIMQRYNEKHVITSTSQLIEKVSEILFTRLYPVAEIAIIDKYVSDADTDVESN